MTTTASPLPAAEERPLRLAPSTTRLPLSRMELFAGLPERDLEMLECRLGVVRWPNGADTPESLERPDHLYLVREGRLAMFERTGPGHEIMIALLEPGSIWSTLGGVKPATLTTLESSAVSPLPGRAIEGLMARYPRLGRNLAGMLSERCGVLAQTVALVSEIRVEDRLRARLHQLAERFGVTTRDGIRLRLELTHAQWASLVGASREAVTTAFGKLKARGDVVLEGRSILIPWDVVRAHEEAMAPLAAVTTSN